MISAEAAQPNIGPTILLEAVFPLLPSKPTEQAKGRRLPLWQGSGEQANKGSYERWVG
jgi:hypothetical protein